MQLNAEEQRFLSKRSRLVQAWRYVGTILLVILIGSGIWFIVYKPLLANPFVVIARLKVDSIPDSTMALMAGILPVVVLMCIVLAVTVVLFAFATFYNEEKYLKIIQRESQGTSFAQQDAPEDAADPRL